MNLNLKGKKALVTGGSKGIGLAIKKALEKEGVKVISWSRSEGYDLRRKIPALPKSVDFIIHNVGGCGTWSIFDWAEIIHKNYGIMAEITTKTWAPPSAVVVISSIYGKERGKNPAFVAAKAAQIGYAKSMSYMSDDTRWNVICPGHIDVGKKFPYEPEKIGQPEDVANLVVFLCSEKAKHINGACITVDGGESHAF